MAQPINTNIVINMNNYIDTHSHILYGIDDGAKTFEDSMNILNKMSSLGYKEIVLTPHYRHPYYADNDLKNLLFHRLVREVKNANLDIKLHLANEVRITDNIIDLVESDQIQLLEDKVLFLELPFANRIYNLDQIIFKLQTKGIKVVIVHPERYDYMTIKDYEELHDKDVLLQVNQASILGMYGIKAKSKAIKLLKMDLVEFLGT
ncbi:MAG TPA: hypothetical protein PLB45_04440, partial [Bacilli bacterium]|nr:hypothetical protein [Bacilli bacterium]